MKLIYAETLKAHYAWWADENKKLFDEIVDAQPEVDAVPVVHGAWIPRDDGYFKNCISQCSACEKRYYVYPNAYNYCPNCGAKMDEEGE